MQDSEAKFSETHHKSRAYLYSQSIRFKLYCLPDEILLTRSQSSDQCRKGIPLKTVTTAIEILLVDSNKENANRLNHALCAPGQACAYRTELAQTIPQAHALMKQRQFHLIIITDGLSDTPTHQLIGLICPSSDIPIIIVGNEDNEQKTLEAVSVGAQDYLTSPKIWDSAYLKRTIRHAIVRHDLKSKLQQKQNRHQQLAYYDPLTQLPNRQLFFDRISQAVNQSKRNQSQFALLFIDLDNFKDINDHYGHNAGDEVLRIVAQRLSKGIRESDTAARLGGDEFTIILNQVHDSEKTASIVNGLLESLQEPILYGQHLLKTSASIGISVYPKDAQSVEDLMTYADQAMYSAKEIKASSYQVFQPHIGERHAGKTLLKSSLKEAIPKGQLKLLYMPRVQLKEIKITSLEGLCYWNHPKLGQLKPTNFIPMASGDLLFKIDQWSIQQACSDLSKLIDKNILNVNISVNISVESFTQLNLDEIICQLHFSPEVLARLEIELPERILLEDCLLVSNKLEKLRNLGIQLVLDNFGSGLTNLNTLKKLHFDFVKIDKGYVVDQHADDIDDRGHNHATNDADSNKHGCQTNSLSLFTAMITLANAFNLTPIVTGIERYSQIPVGQTPEVKYGQGFYFASSPRSFNSTLPLLKGKLETLSA